MAGQSLEVGLRNRNKSGKVLHVEESGGFRSNTRPDSHGQPVENRAERVTRGQEAQRMADQALDKAREMEAA